MKQSVNLKETFEDKHKKLLWWVKSEYLIIVSFFLDIRSSGDHYQIKGFIGNCKENAARNENKPFELCIIKLGFKKATQTTIYN